MTGTSQDPVVAELLRRSNRLGADRRNTNYGGGNTSAKAVVEDPLSGQDVELLWVKGSGGDLATLTAEGLSALVVERLAGLKKRYRGERHEDEMHELLDLCRFGQGGAPPSIDTSMHGLLRAPHVDHLHPDAVIALAAAADGEELTKQCFGEQVAWVPWRRPGFELALRIERIHDARPGLKGVVLGGHGLTTWGRTSRECERNSLELIRRAEEFIDGQGRPEPLGGRRRGFEPLPERERGLRAAALAPVLRGLASTERHVVGHWTDSEPVLDFIAREAAPRVVRLGTSCPDHLIRTKVRPLLLDVPTDAPLPDQVARLRELHRDYRAEYRAYYERYADAATPPMRGADPAIFLVPGVGMFSFGGDSETARVAGEFYVAAINAIRGAEALSTYAPISEAEKFRIEYWALEERKLQRRPRPKPLTGKVAFVTGAGSGIGRAIATRLREEGATVAVADIDAEAARTVAEELGAGDHAIAVHVDVGDEQAVQASAPRLAPARRHRGQLSRRTMKRAMSARGAARRSRGRSAATARSTARSARRREAETPRSAGKVALRARASLPADFPRLSGLPSRSRMSSMIWNARPMSSPYLRSASICPGRPPAMMPPACAAALIRAPVLPRWMRLSVR